MWRGGKELVAAKVPRFCLNFQMRQFVGFQVAKQLWSVAAPGEQEMMVAVVLPGHFDAGTEAVMEVFLLDFHGIPGQCFQLCLVSLQTLEGFRVLLFCQFVLHSGIEQTGVVINALCAHLRRFFHRKEPGQHEGRLIWSAEGVEHGGLAVVGIGQVGMGRNGFCKERDGLRAVATLVTEGCQTVQCPGVVGFQGKGLAEKFFSSFQVTFVAQVKISQDDPAPSVGWVQAQYFDEMVGGMVHITHFHISHGQVPAGVMEGGLQRQYALVDGDGFWEISFGSALGGLSGQSFGFRLGGRGFLRELQDHFIAFDGNDEGLGKEGELFQNERSQSGDIKCAIVRHGAFKLVEVDDLEAESAHYAKAFPEKRESVERIAASRFLP